MSELPPDPPRAKRISAKTVTVRTADPADEPTGPPKVLFWFRLLCGLTAMAALVLMVLLGADVIEDGWEPMHPPWLVGISVAFVGYSLPLWWRRPQRWHWVYGVVMMLPHIVPPVINPLVVALLVFWCRKTVVHFFRYPPALYTAPRSAEPTDVAAANTDPPTAWFALRWMCLIGYGVCLLAVPVTAVVFAADPDAGWGVMGWLGGYAGAFGLFAVPLFARTPRPWVWWYGLGLLVFGSLSLYFTVLAVPILVFWLMKGTRGWFAVRKGTTAAAL